MVGQYPISLADKELRVGGTQDSRQPVSEITGQVGPDPDSCINDKGTPNYDPGPSPVPAQSPWGYTADGRQNPPVISVGATARLVRLAVVARELGVGDVACRNLLRKLGVECRRIGRYQFVHLFQLERALWRWFGLTEDLNLFEFAYRCYADMTTRGVIHHLKKAKLRRLGSTLEKRALLWTNLKANARADHKDMKRPGRLRHPPSFVRTTRDEAGLEVQTGPCPHADHACHEAVRDNPDDDIPGPDDE